MARKERRQRRPERHHRAKIESENVIASQIAPDVGEPLRFLDQRSFIRGEKARVDRAGGDAGDDLKTEIRKMPRDAEKQTDLVRRARRRR